MKLSAKIGLVTCTFLVATTAYFANKNQSNLSCDDLPELIFQDPVNERAFTVAEDCYLQDNALAHSYLQSIFLATEWNPSSEVLRRLAVPDSSSTAESNYKAYRIRNYLSQEEGRGSDEGRRANSYARWSLEHGAPYSSVFFVYLAILQGSENVVRVISSVEGLSEADKSAVNLMFKHWNTTCYYPSGSKPDTTELDVKHYWRSADFVQALSMLQTHACEHVETFLNDHNLDPKILTDFFETALSHLNHQVGGARFSLELIGGETEQLESSVLPAEVQDWVSSYKDSVPDNALNWCDRNHPEELNLCYRTAFLQDSQCMRDLSILGYNGKIRQSGEYNVCRGIGWQGTLKRIDNMKE